MRHRFTKRTVWILGLVLWTHPQLHGQEADRGAAAPAVAGRSGEALVRENCFQCHRSDNPKYPDHNTGWVFGKRYTLAGWKENVSRMEQIALKDEFISEAWSHEDKFEMAKFLAEQTQVTWSETERAGMLHFSVVHFPIALLFVVVLFELLGLVLGWPMRRDLVHLLLFLAVVAAGAAAGLGLLLAKDLSAMSEDLFDHRTAGLATVGFSLGALLFREVTIWTSAGWSRWVYRVLLLLAAAAVGAAGHLGGVLVHGEFLPMMVAG